MVNCQLTGHHDALLIVVINNSADSWVYIFHFFWLAFWLLSNNELFNASITVKYISTSLFTLKSIYEFINIQIVIGNYQAKTAVPPF